MRPGGAFSAKHAIFKGEWDDEFYYAMLSREWADLPREAKLKWRAPTETVNSSSAGRPIILMEPQLGENIGMVARAMANFGLSNLRIVNCRATAGPMNKAVSAAAGASHVIEGAVVFESLPESGWPT